jgi:tRNA-splicing ligase RtcB (3'-phosphate/5'-hydroxy nucleic acid ligase)
MFTGKDLIAAGYKPGPHFQAMLAQANASGSLAGLDQLLPPPELPLVDGRGFALLAEANGPDEAANLAAVRATMAELVKTPVIRAAAAMPDACPAGEIGTIPVGGVAASEAIHPGMHSADICCSVAISVYDNVAPDTLLNAVHAVTHFGPGGRSDMPMPQDVAALVASNPLTRGLADIADYHFGTQGDGNHFAFVGTLASSGQTALVTHHGSRGFGAKLYKIGMKIAEGYRRKLSPETLPVNAWIPPDSGDGEDYWDALQMVRAWTHANHRAIHDATGFSPVVRFWNEHNFVFRRNGLFLHGKGATPAFDDWDTPVLIPLNMAQPVLIAHGLNNKAALGFAPHGAGRNFSRSEHRRRGLGDFAAETAGLDVRFFSGIPDPTELPSGYKDAADVRRQIAAFDLAEIADEVRPYGCIMAGDWEQSAPWRTKTAAPPVDLAGRIG